jgi:DNA modification methylase
VERITLPLPKKQILEKKKEDSKVVKKEEKKKINTIHMKWTSVWNFGNRALEKVLKELKKLPDKSAYHTAMDIFNKEVIKTDQISISYKGRCIPEIPRYCIERYSQEGDLMVDVCMGSGTAFAEAVKLNRRVLGIEPSMGGIEKIKERVEKEGLNKCKLSLNNNNILELLEEDNIFIKGDSRNIPLPDNSIDFAFAHIPYWSVITYTTPEEENEMDISRTWNLGNFNKEILKIYKEVYRVLKNGKYVGVLVGDVRQGGWKCPLGAINTILLDMAGFEFEDMIIKVTDNAISMRRPNIIDRALNQNKTITIHEYIIIGKKKEKKKKKDEVKKKRELLIPNLKDEEN